MNLRKVKEIVKFDVEKSIQNKWFVILNIIVFISILVMTNFDNISKYLNEHNILNNDEVIIQVLDSENLILESLQKKYSKSNIKVEKVTENNYTKENIPKDNVILVEVNLDDIEFLKAKVVSKEGISNDIYYVIYDELKEARSKLFASQNGISIEELNILNEEISIERELLGVDAENSESKEMIKTFSIIIVYIVLIFILSRIASEIAQEKTSKSIEYVLTSVTAKEYLLAKVLGITLTVLVQVLYTFVYYIIGNLISSLFAIRSGVEFVNSIVSKVEPSIVSYVMVMAAYLIFTVFLTALIQATLSSRTTSVSEAGNTTMILMMVVVILYFISLAVISPYSTVSPIMYVISCLPLVSTFFVPSMMIIGQANLVQIIISFVLLIFTVPAIFGICSKYFKNGILDYTTKSKKNRNKKELTLQEIQERDLKASVAKKYAFTLGMSFIILISLQIILSFIFSLILPNLINIDEQNLSIISTGLVSFISLSLTAGFVNLYSKDNKVETKIDGKKSFEYIFGGLALIGIIQFLLNFIYPKIGLDYDVFESVNFTPSNTMFSYVIYFVCIAVIPAIFEELLFRKAILNYSKKYGNTFAVLFSSLLFAIFHMNFSQAIFAFLIGVIFGVIAVKTSSIKLTVLLHFLNNGYAALVTILSGVFASLFNVIVFAILIFGAIILLKNISKLKDLKKEDFNINKDFWMIFKNYTFILSMILLLVMFTVTENMLQFF